MPSHACSIARPFFPSGLHAPPSSPLSRARRSTCSPCIRDSCVEPRRHLAHLPGGGGRAAACCAVVAAISRERVRMSSTALAICSLIAACSAEERATARHGCRLPAGGGGDGGERLGLLVQRARRLLRHAAHLLATPVSEVSAWLCSSVARVTSAASFATCRAAASLCLHRPALLGHRLGHVRRPACACPPWPGHLGCALGLLREPGEGALGGARHLLRQRAHAGPPPCSAPPPPRSPGAPACASARPSSPAPPPPSACSCIARDTCSALPWRAARSSAPRRAARAPAPPVACVVCLRHAAHLAPRPAPGPAPPAPAPRPSGDDAALLAHPAVACESDCTACTCSPVARDTSRTVAAQLVHALEDGAQRPLRVRRRAPRPRRPRARPLPSRGHRLARGVLQARGRSSRRPRWPPRRGPPARGSPRPPPRSRARARPRAPPRCWR